MTDSETGISTTYYYDFTDRILKFVESGSNYSHSVGYGYDTINNLTSLVETIDGTAYTTSYAYDEDNRITSVTSGNALLQYSYDSFGRISQKVRKHNSSAVLTESYTYIAPGSTTTSRQIS